VRHYLSIAIVDTLSEAYGVFLLKRAPIVRPTKHAGGASGMIPEGEVVPAYDFFSHNIGRM
jgi:hypothetical protein